MRLSTAILIIFPFFFVAFWCFTVWLIAAVGGWRELAQVYPAQGLLGGARQWRNKYGRMRYATGYNGCLNIAANAMGMQLSLWSIFRPGHPPLFIPWSEISVAAERGLFFDFIRFSFRRAAPTLLLRRDLAEEILRSGGQARAPVPH